MLSEYNRSPLRRLSGKPPLKHGRFTSPHLVDRWDCITINGETVSESIFKQVESRIKLRNEQENINASEFEVLTATAFEIFTQEMIDIGVIEVGMGGRLDATNILGRNAEEHHPDQKPVERAVPLITVIASIALDHQAFLGDTVEAIAAEKAGICKPGVPVLVGPVVPSVAEVIQAVAKSVGAGPVHFATIPDTAGNIEGGLDVSPEKLVMTSSRLINGEIAAQATWTALKQLNLIQSESPSTPELCELQSRLKEVPRRLVFPGRLQLISLQKLTGYQSPVILDGAHNAESASELSVFVSRTVPGKPRTWLVAFSAGKDVRRMLEILISPQDQVVATTFGSVDGMPWVKPMDPDVIKEEFDSLPVQCEFRCSLTIRLPSANRSTVMTVHNTRHAIYEASRLAERNDSQLVIAGSLYLVGDVTCILRDNGREE